MRNIRGRIDRVQNMQVATKDEIHKNALQYMSLWLQGRKDEITDKMSELYALYNPTSENSIKSRLKRMKETTKLL